MMPYGKLALGFVMTAIMPMAPAFSQTTAAPQPDAQRVQHEEYNKKLAIEFMSPKTTMERRLEIMHPDYVQHNPVFKRFGEINGTHGKGEFELLMKSRRLAPPPNGQDASAPRPPAGDPAYQVMADRDLVTVMQKRYLPDPQNPGQFYETFWFDTWRVKDGKLYEHWDAQTIPAEIPDILKAPVKAN